MNQISPANETAISATDPAFIEAARAGAEAQKKPDSVMMARTPVPALKLVKLPVQPRRPPKPEQPALVEAKPNAGERPPVTASDAAAKTAGQSAAAPSASGQSVDVGAGGAGVPRAEEDRPLFARLRLVPSWFSPGTDRVNDKAADERPSDVPRPPMPVGEPRSMM